MGSAALEDSIVHISIMTAMWWIKFFTCMMFFSCKMQMANQQTEKQPAMVLQMKQYDNEPIYRLKVSSSLSYRVKVNGITTATKNQNAGEDRWFLFNNCIPAQGLQDIEIAVLPAMNGAGTQYQPFIGNKGFFELEVELVSWKNGSLTEPEVVFKYELPAADYTNKSVVLVQDKFTAKVPYQLVDWRKGLRLTSIDSDRLKEAVMQSYQKLKSQFEQQQGEAFVKLVEAGMFNIAQSAYLTPEEFDKMKSDKAAFINKQVRELESFDNYTLEITGDDKLVSLRRVDGYNANEGVLRRRYTKGGQETVHIDDIVWYAPPASDSVGFPELKVVVYQNLVKPFCP